MPAATLTFSTIEHVKGYPSAYSLATSQALSGLTGLRDLTLYCCVKEPVGRLSEGCLHGVAQLSLLTALRLSRTAEDAELLLLPQQLQILELSTCCGKQPLQLQHLTGLESLELNLVGAPAAKSTLPQQLAHLAISTRGAGAESDQHLQHLGLGSLQQLVTIEVSNGMSEQLMHRVACLPKLQHVLLRYTYGSVALRAAPGWQHLPQLRGLVIDDSTTRAYHLEETEDLVQHIGAATSLTSVLITTRVLYSDAQICRHLTGLQQLRELELGYEAGRGYPRDTLHLTALTGLTWLVLFGTSDMDDVGAVAIASWLRQLRNLQLVYCRLGSAAIAAIGSLTQLTNLVLNNCSVLPEHLLPSEDIMLLSALTQLRGFDFCDTFSRPAARMYMRHMRRVWGLDFRSVAEPASDAADDTADDAADDAAAIDAAADDAADDAVGVNGHEADSDDEL